MKKTLAIGIVACLIVISGALWFGSGSTLRQHSGEVLGDQANEASTMPADAVLLLGGPAGDQLFWWRPESGVRVHPQFVGKSVAAVAATADGLVIAIRQARGTLLATLPSSTGAITPLLALDGTVQQLATAPNGRFVSVLQTRNTAPELDVVDLVSGRLTRVAQNILAAAWLSRTPSILSYDADGQIRYHGISVAGALEPPQELIRSAMPPVVEPVTDRILFVPPDTPDLVAYDLPTREQRLIMPLPGLPPSAPLRITLSPSGNRAVLTVASATPAETQQLLIDVRTGASRVLAVPGTVRTWYGEDGLIAAARQNGQALLYTLPTDATELLGDQNTHPLP